MTILFSAVANGPQVLAQSASCEGNFVEVMTQILKRIPGHDERRTLTSGNFLFNYICEDKIIYFCITTDKFPILTTFRFLSEIQQRFQSKYGETPSVELPHVMMQSVDGGFSRVLDNEMTRYNDTKTSIPKVKAELDQLKSIMVQNVDKIALRGERLENLMLRTSDLSDNTVVYRRSAVRVQRKYWWKNMKWNMIIALVVILLVYFIGAGACGGLAWKSCVS